MLYDIAPAKGLPILEQAFAIEPRSPRFVSCAPLPANTYNTLASSDQFPNRCVAANPARKSARTSTDGPPAVGTGLGPARPPLFMGYQ